MNIEKENSKTKLGYYNLPSTGYDGRSRRDEEEEEDNLEGFLLVL